MNNRGDVLFDFWTIIHFASGIILGLMLLPMGWQIEWFILFFAGFEILEHILLGNEVFRWTSDSYEEPLNGVVDVIVAIFGVMVAMHILGMN